MYKNLAGGSFDPVSVEDTPAYVKSNIGIIKSGQITNTYLSHSKITLYFINDLTILNN